MPSVQIKHVPDDVHSILRGRAAAAGQSMQEYLLAVLSEHARMPTMNEFLDRLDARRGPGEPAGGGVTSAEIVEAVRADRDARWDARP